MYIIIYNPRFWYYIEGNFLMKFKRYNNHHKKYNDCYQFCPKW